MFAVSDASSALITAVVGAVIGIAGLVRSIRTDRRHRLESERAVDVDRFEAVIKSREGIESSLQRQIDDLRKENAVMRVEIERCEASKQIQSDEIRLLRFQVAELQRGAL